MTVLKVRHTGPVDLQLPLEMIEDLKREAVARGVSYHRLIRIWLAERLKSERSPRRKPLTSRSHRSRSSTAP